jgi:hypothetical protein
MLQEKEQKTKTYLHTVIDVAAGAIAAPASSSPHQEPP